MIFIYALLLERKLTVFIRFPEKSVILITYVISYSLSAPSHCCHYSHFSGTQVSWIHHSEAGVTAEVAGRRKIWETSICIVRPSGLVPMWRVSILKDWLILLRKVAVCSHAHFLRILFHLQIWARFLPPILWFPFFNIYLLCFELWNVPNPLSFTWAP